MVCSGTVSVKNAFEQLFNNCSKGTFFHFFFVENDATRYQCQIKINVSSTVVIHRSVFYLNVLPPNNGDGIRLYELDGKDQETFKNQYYLIFYSFRFWTSSKNHDWTNHNENFYSNKAADYTV